MTNSSAYERLQQAAAEASSQARLLALVILRDVYQEYAALDAEWRDRQDPTADEVRAVLARIQTALGPAAERPPRDESLEERAARLVRHLFDGQPDGSSQ